MPDVFLQWSPRTTPDGYRIYRSATPFSEDSLPSVLVTLAGTLTKYTDPAPLMVPYYYMLEAFTTSPAASAFTSLLYVVPPILSGGAPAPPPASTWEYWRVELDSANGGNVFSFLDFQLLQDGVDVTTGGTATASSVYNNLSSLQPVFGIDANLSTEWASQNATNQWFQVQLTEAAAPTEVAIRAILANRGPFIWRVLQSNDGVTFETVKEFNTPEIWATSVTKTLSLLPSPSASVVGSTSSTTATAAVPAEAVEGHLLVAFVGRGNSAIGTAWTPPTGWTKIHEVANNTNRANIGAFWKVAGGSEPAGYEFLAGETDNNKYATVMYAISGADNASPIIDEATRQQLSNTVTHALGAVTSTNDGALRLGADFGGWGGPYSSTPPMGMTEDHDFSTVASGSGGGVLGAAHQVDCVAATYSGHFRMSVGLHYASSHLLIKPAS